MVGSRRQPVSLLVFDLGVGGHHPAYIRHIVRAWPAAGQPGRLVVVASSELAERHPDVVAAGAEAGAEFSWVTAEERAGRGWARRLGRAGGLLSQAAAEWRVLSARARELEPAACLALYVDRLLQGPLALGLRLPAPLSGIHFRPSFHYAGLAGGARLTVAERVRGVRQRVLLELAARNPSLRTLFVLDPLAAERLGGRVGRVRVVPVPDPVSWPAGARGEPERLRARLGVTPGRTVGLLFGAMTARKGVFPLLAAVRRLPQAQAARLCVLLAGSASPAEAASIGAEIARTRRLSAAQIVWHEGYIDEAAVPDYFAASDFVLAPYQRHVGSSGLLVQAARAERPVLGSDYGLLGELTRRNRLGLAVDAGNPAAIAEALGQLIEGPAAAFADPAGQRDLAARSTPEAFTRCLFDHALGALKGR